MNALLHLECSECRTRIDRLLADVTRFPAATRLMLLAAWCACGVSLRAEGFWSTFWRPPVPVIVSATAADDYTQKKFGPVAPKPETYLFFQGKVEVGTPSVVGDGR